MTKNKFNFQKVSGLTKNAESALRESEEKYHRLFERSNFGIFQSTPEGKAISVNPAFAAMFGYDSPEDAIKHIKNVSADVFADSNRRAEIIRLMEENPGLKSFENIYKRKDGSSFTGTLNVIQVRDLQGRIIYLEGFIEDITERRRLEEQLLASRQQLSSIYDSVGDIIFYLAVETSEKYRFVSINKAFCDITGLSQEQVVGRLVNEVIPEPSLPMVLDKYKQAIAGKKRIRWEETSDYPSGRLTGEVNITPVFDDDGHCINLVGSVHDITRRVAAERALDSEKRRLLDILKGTNAGSWEWNIQTGETILNERWAEIIGYTLEEISPTSIETWRKFVHPEDAKLSDEFLQKHFNKELDYYECEARMKHKNGSWVWVLDRGRVHEWDEKGRPLLMSGTHQDINKRKQAEKAFKDSLSLTEATLESIHNGILVVDHKGTVIKTNAKFAEMWDIPGDILKSGDDSILVDHVLGQVADPGAFINKITELYGKPQAESIDWINFKDGRIFERISKPMYIEGTPKGRVWSFLDITARKQSQEALLESERFLRASQMVARLGSFVWDITEGLWNSSEILDDIFGIDEHYVRSFEGWAALIHPDWQEIMKDYVVKEVLGKRKKFDKEYQIIRKNDGQVHWVHGLAELELDDEGRPIKLIGTISDVTERKRAEKELIASENRNKALLNAIPDLMFMFNREGVFVDFHTPDPKSLITGPKNFLGLSVSDVLPEELAALTLSHLQEVFKKGKTSVYEYSILEGNEELIYESRIVACGKDLALSIVRDISDKKKIEYKMIQSERLTALGEMSAGMAHEINQPLNTLSILFDNILFEAKLNHAVSEEYLVSKSDKIFNNILRIKNLIDHVREFSRSQEGYIFTPFNINESILNALSMVSEQFKINGITLVTDLVENLPLIKGNTYKFEQVILNLILNSKDALFERMNDLNESYLMLIRITTKYDSEKISIHVEDNGTGIKDEHRDKIFQPFYTTKETGKGTGLGLSISYGLIREINGEIDIQSKVQQGTIISITIPYKIENK